MTEERAGADGAARTAPQWLAEVIAAERRGELLAAFDLAERGLERYPDDLGLRHRAVLALARAGSTEEAERRFDLYRLGEVENEDAAALGARLAKDRALASTGEERRRRAKVSAGLYEAIFARTGGYYPAINAATLWMIAGDDERCPSLARRVLELLAAGKGSYYEVATEAEANLLLGRVDQARALLEQAAGLHGGDHGAVATTRRQLRLVCGAMGIGNDVLAPLRQPTVVHYCGHLISAGEDGRFPARAEPVVAARIAAELARDPVGYAYGALACGGDILCAEALLAQGAQLHVVLPFAREEFVAASVAPGGAGWPERFERCLAAAASVDYATEDAFLGDEVLYSYGSELAIGLALLRARFLDSEPRQLVVWDGSPPQASYGTAVDVSTWRRLGHALTVVSPNGSSTPSAPSTATGASPSPRRVRALLFADVSGFSRLSDEQLPRFAERVLGAFASVLERHADRVCYRNTWGDGLYVVLDDVAGAAACALELQRTFSELDLAAAGLPPLALRLAAHVGPVFEFRDPVLDAPAFMGSHVSRTARVEPVTPPGTVYVTDAFAAALLVDGRNEFACDYVGHMPAAKDYGRLRMYRLRRV